MDGRNCGRGLRPSVCEQRAPKLLSGYAPAGRSCYHPGGQSQHRQWIHRPVLHRPCGLYGCWRVRGRRIELSAVEYGQKIACRSSPGLVHVADPCPLSSDKLVAAAYRYAAGWNDSGAFRVGCRRTEPATPRRLSSHCHARIWRDYPRTCPGTCHRGTARASHGGATRSARRTC